MKPTKKAIIKQILFLYNTWIKYGLTHENTIKALNGLFEMSKET
jgi:hypothetical protein